MLSLRISWERCEIYAMHRFIQPEKLMHFPLNSVDRIETGLQEFGL